MADKPNQQQTTVDPQREAMRAAAQRIDRVNDWLRVGGAVPPEQYERLCEAGIARVVDLREFRELEAGIERLGTLGIERHHAPVPNFTAPRTEQLPAIAQWLEGGDPNGTVYVHCGGGFGRAATIAVALLVLRDAALDDAIAEVRAARPEIRINDVQLAWLRTVEGRSSNRPTR